MKQLRFTNGDGTLDITYLVDLIGTNDACTVYQVIQKVNNVETSFGLNAAAYAAGFTDNHGVASQQTTLTVMKAFASDNNYTLIEYTPGAAPVTHHSLTALNITTSSLTAKVHAVLQKETAVLVGTIPTATRQVETATIVGTIEAAGAGDATVTVTAAGLPGNSVVKAVAVENNDTAAQVATKIRASLAADADITALYSVGGLDADVVLTAITAADNDDTLNIAYTNDSCLGLTPDATSADTTPGVASGAGNATITVTSALLDADEVISVALADGDAAAVGIGTKVRAALNANTNITTNFTVGGSGANVSLECKLPAANDDTLNIAYTNDTCTGLTPDASSNHTTAGAAGTLVNQTLVAEGGNAPYVWTTASTLPSGVVLRPAGVLYGLPMEAGTFPVVLTVTDRFGITDTANSMNLVIS